MLNSFAEVSVNVFFGALEPHPSFCFRRLISPEKIGQNSILLSLLLLVHCSWNKHISLAKDNTNPSMKLKSVSRTAFNNYAL